MFIATASHCLVRCSVQMNMDLSVFLQLICFLFFFLSSIFLLINVFVQLTSLKHSWLLSVFENVRDHPQPYMLHKKDPNARHTDRQAGSITKKI